MAKYPSQPFKFMHGDAEVFGQYYCTAQKQSKQLASASRLTNRSNNI